MKRNIKCLVLSVVVFALLFSVLCLNGEERTVYNVDGTGNGMQTFPDEEEAVKYIGSDFTVSDYSKSVKKGGQAFVKIHSVSGSDVKISVYYASGKSASSVFVPKTPDLSGVAGWEWRVSANTSAERIRVVLRSEFSYALLYIDIT